MDFDLGVIGAGLPVATAVAALQEALASNGCVVVQASPGTGKTTLVPPLVANLVEGRVLVSQPRRVAARAAARRLAQLCGERVGERSGFVVRGEHATSARTRVEFCTAGVLLRRLISDPELSGGGAVVLDEVHERSIDGDLTFAMLAELRQLRPDLVLVVMSATLDAERWSALLHGAPVVRADAELHPLEVRHAPPSGARTDTRGVSRAFCDHVAQVAAATVDAREGRVLVFMPGAAECDRVAQSLLRKGIQAVPLHGSLPPAAQDDALAGDARVVVATSIAESSLTVPGVHTVVDSGLSREPRVDASRGMAGLVTVAAPRSSVEQRAGRAARLGPGLVVRCFPADDMAGLRPFAVPEILTSDLVGCALDLACWGSPRGEGLPLPDAPPPVAIDAAEGVLRGLGAVDADGRATQAGRRLARLPVSPRWGRALLDCAAVVGARPAAEVVALLEGDERIAGADAAAALRRVRRDRPRAWVQEADRLERLLDGSSGGSGRPADEDAVAHVIAAAWPDRVARRRGDEYLMASGTAAELPRDSALGAADWLAVADVVRVGDRAVIRAAAVIDEATALAQAEALLVTETVARWDRGRVQARRVRRLGAIELSATPVQASPEEGRAAVARALQDKGFAVVVGWPESTEALRRRLAAAERYLGEPWPDVSDDALLAGLEEWLSPELEKLATGTAASRLDLTSALRRLVPWSLASRLEAVVPERLEVPTGSHIRLEYPADPADRVVLEVKLQECFGLVETPRLCEGRATVLMHLLSPAGRPLAVTDDLASFWVNAYPAVRAENRGRYPRHPWPEDPLTAPPRRGTTRSGR